jgi:hypothetical protein
MSHNLNSNNLNLIYKDIYDLIDESYQRDLLITLVTVMIIILAV